MSSKSIGEVANYKPLARCGMEELAVRQQRLVPSGGIQFVRATNRENKDTARQAVLDLFAPDRWPGYLHFLTLPSLDWRFERLLLAQREVGWLRAPNPHRTFFTSVENDRSIYFAAAAQMPGTETPNRVIKHLNRNKGISFAEIGVKTKYAAFFFADVDDLLIKTDWNGWDAAWLDYTGPLTTRRLKLIAQFYQTQVRDTLIVTALKARWNDETTKAINKAGGHSRWLRQHLPGEILHEIEYYDTVPMAQFAVRHPHDLGHVERDAQRHPAGIAAVGLAQAAIQLAHADGGTPSENLGRPANGAQTSAAEIAAVGQHATDIQDEYADGGTPSENLGHFACDTQFMAAGITPSASPSLTPTPRVPTASNSPKRRKKKWQKSKPKRSERKSRKRQSRVIANASKNKQKPPSPRANQRRSQPRKKLSKLSAPEKISKKKSEKMPKQRSNKRKISAARSVMPMKQLPRLRPRPVCT
jgi:hypothetical protein